MSKPETVRTEGSETAEKAAFETPRLRFVEPKLSAHGDLAEVTKGFFGSFSP